ncbi:hypothetical protein ACJMK2_023686, partial [Sinanodonta woodiana]
MSAGSLLVDSKTKRYNIPISHLDFGYIENCSDIQELEKILRILKSGEEGTYPDLERLCEERVQALNPNSRALRKEVPVLKPSDLPCEERQDFDKDLTNWSQNITDIDRNLQDSATKLVEETYLPPIRNPVILDSKGKKAEPRVSEDTSSKRVLPRDYKEWDKFDIEKELEKVDGEDNKCVPPLSDTREKVSDHIDDKGLTSEEKVLKASREKDKGNEAIRANDYEEAVQYYSRSISLMPTIATYNNRSLAYLKMEDWSKALKDCNTVLKSEPDNIKALLRRGSAYKGSKNFDKARNDLIKVLELEPNNKKAEELLKELDQAVVKEEKEKKERKEKGRRMVIEEFDGSNLKSDTQDFESNADNSDSNLNGCDKTKSRRMLIEEVNEGTDKCEMHTLNDEIYLKADCKQNGHSVEKEEAGHRQIFENNETPKEEGKSIWSDSEVDSLLSEDAKVQSSESTSDKPRVLENIADKKHRVSRESHTNIEADIIRDDIQSSLGNSEHKLKDSIDILKESNGSYDVDGGDSGDSSYPVKIDQRESSNKDNVDQEAITENKTVEQDSDGEIKNFEEESLSQDVRPAVTRPVFIQSTLPEEISQLREAGNNFFRTGQYSEACNRYTDAIQMLEKDKSDQTVNLSLLYSNRAAAKLKIGELATAIQDCTCSLELVPHSVKPLLRRAQAYQMSERYNKAYVDYRHALILDSSIEQAHHGLTMCQNMLQQQDGPKWREMLPQIPSVMPWEIPEILSEEQSMLRKNAPSLIVGMDQGEWQEPPTVLTTVPQIVNNDESREWQEPAITPTTAAPIINMEQPREQEEPLAVPVTQPQKDNKEKTFDDLKAEGNEYVKEGKFRDAIKCYTECIGLSPDESVSFTNRALCYLRINEPSSAEKDCDQALNLDGKNIKALFRRAQAKKMLQRYKESLEDLTHLLKLEPQNTAAKKEMDLVKNYWRQDFAKIKEQMPSGIAPKPQSASSSDKAKTKSTPKQRKRMVIEEVEEEGIHQKNHSKQNDSGSGDSESKQNKKADKKKATTVDQSKSHVENQSKVQPKIPKEEALQKPKSSSKSSKTSEATTTQKSKSQEQKTKSAVKQASVGLPKVAPSVPKLEKTTPYEFISAWNSLKSADSLQPYYDLLKQVPPEEIPNVVSNKLDDKMLTTITRCVHDHFIKDGEIDTGFKILQHLSRVPRFQTVAMFLNP